MLKTAILADCKKRRQTLMDSDPDGCFVFFGGHEIIRNNDSHFPFRQDSDFYYLTEFDEPGAALVLVHGKSYLFVLERDADREIWDGERYGIDRAKLIFDMDATFLVRDFYPKLDEFLTDAKRVYYRLGEQTVQAAGRDEKMIRTLHQASRFQGKGSHGLIPIHDPAPMIASQRLVKDEVELALIRKACSVSARGHLQLLKRVRAGMTEFEACAEFKYSVYKNGCTDMGYTPIFASGYNATTLHYNRNNEMLKHGDLLLVDAGAEVGLYTADITQTFPVSGTFSPEQRQVYEKVLGVNRAITAMIKPGISYRDLHSKSAELVTEALLELGVLTGDLRENVIQMNFRKYYPHGLGHYLGLDVHDAGVYHERGQDVLLKPGMILTNEPGLYFRDRGTPYFGIGIRIEDDILVTENGCEVMTRELPRDIETIEQLRTIANA
jgi:Xaa-Pro aminopeptidase